MAQAGPVVWGRFDEMIRQYKAPPACACTEEFYETDPRNDFVRGYALQTVAPLPIAMAHLIAERGRALRRGAAGGDAGLQPLRRHRRARRDPAGRAQLRHAPPDARRTSSASRCRTSHFNLFENDRRMMRGRHRPGPGGARRRRARRETHCRQPLRPSGRAPAAWASRRAIRWWTAGAEAGTCRTCFVCDGSVLPTQGSANPALTISALAARTADWIHEQAGGRV